MRKEFVATAAALAMLIAAPLFAQDWAPPFAGEEDRYFEDRRVEEDDTRYFPADEDAYRTFAEDTYSPGIDRRELHQARQIEYGKRIGSISPREAFRLKRLLARIERTEQQFKADGHFTRAERTRIHRMLDDSGRNIQLAMNNGRFGW